MRDIRADRPCDRSTSSSIFSADSPTAGGRRRAAGPAGPAREPRPSTPPSCDRSQPAPPLHATTGQVIRLQDLHHFLRILHARLHVGVVGREPRRAGLPGDQAVLTSEWGEKMAAHAENWGRQWGFPMAAYGEIPMAAVSVGVARRSQAWHSASPPSAATDLGGCLLASRWTANSGRNRRGSFSGIAATRGRRGRPLVPSSGSANSRSRRASPRPECLQERRKHSVLGLATSGFRPDWRRRPRLAGSRAREAVCRSSGLHMQGASGGLG